LHREMISAFTFMLQVIFKGQSRHRFGPPADDALEVGLSKVEARALSVVRTDPLR